MSAVPRPGVYERAQPIFDRRRRRFHPIAELVDATVVGGTQVHLELRTRDGGALRGRLTFPDPEVVRVQWGVGARPGEHLTEMLVGAPATLPVTLTADGDTVTVSAGGTPVVLDKARWRLAFGPYRTEPQDTSLVEYVAEAGGWALDGNATQTYETFALRPGEQLVGLGERFLGPGLRGRRLAHWIDEPFGTNTTDRVYKSVPLVLSSRGYGVFFHHPEEAWFDLGAGSTASASVLVHAAEMDYFVLLGEPKQVLARYTDLTGRPPVPPDWSFGVWLSKCMYANREEVVDVVETAERLGIPCDVVNLDPLWLANRAAWTSDFCDFVWDEKAFGPMGDFIAWLHDRDVRLCLWVNPHVMDSTDAFVPERLVSGGAARDPFFHARAFVDFTGAGADWWHDELSKLVAAGVDAFKLDYGELLPADARMADGRRGTEVHNVYSLLASKVAYEAGIGLAFTRSGTAGSQRYPLHWSGDAQSTWAGMAGCLRGALALAWSGYAYWACDISGFFLRDVDDETSETFGFSRPGAELHIRWTQWGMLCSHTRFHGTQGREPWLFGDEAVAVARDFGALRKRLQPYLLRCAAEAAEHGVPVMRPLALEFPDDPTAWTVDTQYLLGPALLVAPVLEEGGRVDVYVPEGTWTDHFTGEQLTGPRWVHHDAYPLDRIPLLVRDGHTPFAP